MVADKEEGGVIEGAHILQLLQVPQIGLIGVTQQVDVVVSETRRPEEAKGWGIKEGAGVVKAIVLNHLQREVLVGPCISGEGWGKE